MTTEEKIEVMQAYVDGKKIEINKYLDNHKHWIDIKEPTWNWGINNYRVKPEEPKKKCVPLTYEDLLDRVKNGETMWISCEDFRFVKLIIFFDYSTIRWASGCDVKEFVYDELMGYNFIDGTPCWKEVEERREINKRESET